MHTKEDIKVKGCGCRFRGEECEHLCDRHKDEFILKQYNKDKNFRQDIAAWMEIADEMIDKEAMKDMERYWKETSSNNNS